MEENDEEKLTLKEFVGIVVWIFKILWGISPVLITFYLIARILQELQGLVYAYIFALIIDRLIELATSTDAELSELYPYLAILFIYHIATLIINEIANYGENMIREKANFELVRMLYSKVISLGVETSEDPDFVNKLTRANNEIWGFANFLNRIAIFVARMINTVISGITLATFLPIMIPILIVLAIPRMIIEQHFLKKNWDLYKNTTEDRRKAQWGSWMLTDPSSLQEISVIRAYKYLDKIYCDFKDYFLGKLTDNNNKWYSISFILGTLNSIFIFVGYSLILKNLISGLISVGNVTFQIRTLDIFYSAMFWGVFQIFSLRHQSVRFKEVKQIFDMQPKFEDGRVKIEINSAPSIEFKNVSFTYPNSEKPVIKNLNLDIRPGEKIAIVGKNGAGKTTLVKLISRFYRVNKGELLINDQDINTFDIDSWYKHIGVLYQEYNTYGQLSAKENIFIGDLAKDHNDEQILKAAENADADEFIKEYKRGFDQILSERFKGGIRPSTGQWQKIALARFFYRNSPLIIFDEPTAAIDAESEYKIFNRIYDFFENKTVIIISHRFSTVRNADRIIVFDKGKIIEEGSHKELLEKDGQYAKAFKLQAEGYN